MPAPVAGPGEVVVAIATHQSSTVEEIKSR